MTILVVDDSRAMRMLITRTLRHAGLGHHRVLEAADGVDGLLIALAQQPDLILADWTMPRASGLELLQSLRMGGSQVPFGFVTAQATPQRQEVAAQEGALFCVGKPMSPELLADLLAQEGLSAVLA